MQRRVQLMQSLGWHAHTGFEMDNDSEKWVSGSMTSWPCDGLVIYESDALKFYLGGIASALRVDEIDDPDLELVITVNKDDQLQRGCPHSWKTFFEERGLANLRYGGFDKGGLGVVWQYLEKIQECLTIWSAFVHEFEVWRPARASAAGQVVVLVHCLPLLCGGSLFDQGTRWMHFGGGLGGFGVRAQASRASVAESGLLFARALVI